MSLFLFLLVSGLAAASAYGSSLTFLFTVFIEILDEIYEILMNFGNSIAVFIVGDMKSSLTLRSSNEREIILSKFVSENGLHYFQNGEPKYMHSDNTSFSEIDYILCNAKGKELVMNVKVEKDCTLNMTDHLPIIAELNIPTTKAPTKQMPLTLKPKQERCNKMLISIRCASEVV